MRILQTYLSGLEGGFTSPFSPFLLSAAPASLRLPAAALAALPQALAAFPPQPEYEGGFNPHNQPRGFVARPKAALIAKNLPQLQRKPDTIASRVRARLRVRARVSRWLAWITYLTQGE